MRLPTARTPPRRNSLSDMPDDETIPLSKSEAEKAVKKAGKEWRAAKQRERESRELLATLVREVVGSKVLNENKVSKLTDIPRMTIRKMLGK